MPTLNNYTVSDAVFSVVEGSSIYGTQQTATLTIIPNTGFTVDYQDFSIVAGTLPSEVDSVVFQQDGNNVLCIATFNSTVVMPSENLMLNLCVEGSATEKKFLVKGLFNEEYANYAVSVASDPVTKAYAVEGLYGETKKIIEWTITTPNALYEIISNTDVISLPNSNYTYTITPTYDINGNYDSSLIEVFYTFPDYNFDAGVDYVTLYTGGVEIFAEEPVITAYRISTANIPAYGGFVNITIYGNPGAVFSLERNDNLGTELLLEDIEMTEYRYTYVAEIPSATANAEYEFVISGDLSDTFDTAQGQQSSFIVYQYLPVTITFDAIGADLTGYSSTYRLYNAFQQPIPGSSASHVDILWEIESSTAADLEIIKEIENSDWSNLYVYSYELTADCNNSNTLTLESTDNLVAGMDVNLGTTFSSIKIDTVVDATTITITEPITLASGNSVDFYSSNDNIVTMSTSMSLSSDSKTVAIIASIDIIQYGYDNIDFVLNLDNIIAENTGASCVEFFATTELYPSTISYLDCSGNFQSFDMDPNQISVTYSGLAGSISFTGGDTIITLV